MSGIDINQLHLHSIFAWHELWCMYMSGAFPALTSTPYTHLQDMDDPVHMRAVLVRQGAAFTAVVKPLYAFITPSLLPFPTPPALTHPSCPAHHAHAVCRCTMRHALPVTAQEYASMQAAMEAEQRAAPRRPSTPAATTDASQVRHPTLAQLPVPCVDGVDGAGRTDGSVIRVS